MADDSHILERRFVAKGTLVMREGDPANNAYLIQSGRVSVFTQREDRKVELARLDAGDIFGEMALIFDEPRSASVIALDDVTLIAITRKIFKHKLNKSDPTIQAVLRMLTQRMVTANNLLIQKKMDIQGLRETNQMIYQNIHDGLPRNQQRTFQNAVLPKLEEFLKALDAFSARQED